MEEIVKGLEHETQVSTPVLALMVVFSVVTAAFAVWYMFRITKGLTGQDSLIKLLMFMLVVIVSIYLVDKIVSIRRDLLTDGENTAIFGLIKEFMMAIFGYVLRGKQDENKL
jgi:hypothetical protein